MKNTNININERANMTKTQLDLRIENGENIDPREEVVVKEDTIESIFAEADAKRSSAYGEHRVYLRPIDRKNDVVRTVQIVKNGVTTETKPYIRLSFVDENTGLVINLATDREKDSSIRYTKRFYAGMVESLRKNINLEYAGVAEPMATSEMLEFLENHPISIWLRWNAQYQKVEADFFDRDAWEAAKAEKAKVAASSRKGSKQRVTENKAVK